MLKHLPSNFRLIFLGLLLLGMGFALENTVNAQSKFSGTYRIQSWRDLEKSRVYQYFYLHPQGKFLLAAEWPGNESSRFVGRWSVSGDFLSLRGKGWVNTNQGKWNAAYQRTFKIESLPTGIRLVPQPEKNRFGLMGWPDPFVFYRNNPVSNLPGVNLPADEAGTLALITKLEAEQQTK